MKTGITVWCQTCRRPKAPRGRSVPDITADSYCRQMGDCAGYSDDPQPGDLWPGESDEDFGYPCSDNATEEK